MNRSRRVGEILPCDFGRYCAIFTVDFRQNFRPGNPSDRKILRRVSQQRTAIAGSSPRIFSLLSLRDSRELQ